MKTLIAAILLSGSLSALADTMKEKSLKFVPGGTVVEERSEEVKVKTPAGTIVEIEFDKNSIFEEASGNSLEQDLFQPEAGLLSLKDAVASMTKAGKKPVGEWSFDSSLMRGWYYEFEGYEDGKKMDYVLDAKSGKLLDSKIDD